MLSSLQPPNRISTTIQSLFLKKRKRKKEVLVVGLGLQKISRVKKINKLGKKTFCFAKIVGPITFLLYDLEWYFFK